MSGFWLVCVWEGSCVRWSILGLDERRWEGLTSLATPPRPRREESFAYVIVLSYLAACEGSLSSSKEPVRRRRRRRKRSSRRKREKRRGRRTEEDGQEVRQARLDGRTYQLLLPPCLGFILTFLPSVPADT